MSPFGCSAHLGEEIEHSNKFGCQMLNRRSAHQSAPLPLEHIQYIGSTSVTLFRSTWWEKIEEGQHEHVVVCLRAAGICEPSKLVDVHSANG